MRVILEVIAGPEAGRRVWLQTGQVLIVGRSDLVDAGFPVDNQMSGRHFSLSCGTAECHLKDFGSTNGTFVNGQRVTEYVLGDADEVAAGQTRFRIRLEDAPAPLASSRPPAVAAATVATEATPLMAEVPRPDPESQPQQSPAVLADAPAETKTANTTAVPPVSQDEAPLQMLALVNETPFPAATMFWTTTEGEARLTVIVKATFAFVSNGVAAVAEEQLPILKADKHEGDDPLAPVRFETDMVPLKPRSDLILVGQAHAPYGRPVTELDVRLRVGTLEKKVRVFGDRTWLFPSALMMVPKISKPAPFVTMKLGYDRAFGGIDAVAALYCRENLIGKGFIGVKTEKTVHEKLLPNLEDPNNLIDSWKSHPKPVGFGFYGRGWMPRLAYAGTYDEKYRKERAPAPPLDFSPAFFNGAHPDLQWDGYLEGDETIEMENFVPQGTVRFQLPGVRPVISIRRLHSGSSQGEVVPGRFDTLVLLPDEGICYAVFREVFSLPSLDNVDVAAITVTM
jgi:hypothetical protein